MSWIFILIRWRLLQLVFLPVPNLRQILSVLCAVEQPNTMMSHLFPSLPLLMFTAFNFTRITIPWIVCAVPLRSCADSLSPTRFSFAYLLRGVLIHCLSPVCPVTSSTPKRFHSVIFSLPLLCINLSLPLVYSLIKIVFPLDTFNFITCFQFSKGTSVLSEQTHHALFSAVCLMSVWILAHGRQANMCSEWMFESVTLQLNSHLGNDSIKKKDIHSYVLFSVTSILYDWSK